MRNEKGYTLVELLIWCILLSLSVAGAGGWIWNIVKLAHSDFARITGMLALRIVGIFVPPLGAILGFL